MEGRAIGKHEWWHQQGITQAMQNDPERKVI